MNEVVAAVREWVDAEVIPTASELEHADEYPEALVQGMRDLGLFGVAIPEPYGGLGLDLETYAHDQRGALARLDVARPASVNGHFVTAWMIETFGTARAA